MAIPRADLIAVLQELTAEEMRSFLETQIMENDEFSSRFLARYAHRVRLGVKEYKAIITEAMYPLAVRHGFLHPSRAMEALSSVDEILKGAKVHGEAGRHEPAAAICQAVIEKVAAAYNTIDDSNGLLSPLVSEAFRILEDMQTRPLPEPLRRALFDWCVKGAVRKAFQGWDTPWQLASLAAGLAVPAEERELVKLTDTIRKSEGRDWLGDHHAEKAAAVLLRYVSRTKTPGEVEAFVQENLRYPTFRKKAIEQAMANSDFTRALALAEEGVEQAKSNRHDGHIKDFLEAQLTVYKAMGDKARQIETAEVLFRRARYDTRHFFVLKELMTPRQWQQHRPAFLEKIRNEGDLRSLALIYAGEGELDLLMGTLEESGRLELVKDHEPLLLPQYAARLQHLLFRIITEDLARRAVRPTYAYHAKLLKKMLQKYDADGVKAFAEQLIREHKMKPALVEEFRKAGF